MRIEAGQGGRLGAAVLTAALVLARVASAEVAVVDFAVDRLGAAQGLSQGSVVVITQDQRGFLWFGTEDGVNRYDGSAFTVFRGDVHDPDGLPHSYVQSLLHDRAGRLWAGTIAGLARFDPLERRFVHVPWDSSPGAVEPRPRVTALLEARDGTLWIASEGSGLSTFDPDLDRVRPYTAGDDPSILTRGNVRGLVEREDGSLWIGTDAGLHQLDPLTGHVERRTDLTDVRALFEDSSGVLWIGTEGKGAFELLPSGALIAHRHDPDDPRALPSDCVTAFVEDHLGYVWLGTREGLSRFSRHVGDFETHVHLPADPRSLPIDSVRSLYEDRSGVLWIGTDGGGLAKVALSPSRFPLYRVIESSPGAGSASLVLSVIEAPLGELWIGTEGAGLVHFDRRTRAVRRYRHDPRDPTSLANNHVRSLLYDDDGLIWVGTDGDGVDVLDPTTGVFRHHAELDPEHDGPLNQDVRQVVQDRRGDVWIAMHGTGVVRRERRTGRVEVFRHDPRDPSSLADDLAYALFEDVDGTIWVGTDGGGLDHLVGGRFVHHRHVDGDDASFPNDFVLAVTRDRAGTMWLGSDGGLIKIDRVTGRVHTYTVADGLPNHVVYSVIEDRTGHLWMSTNRGVARFDPTRERFTSFERSQGLQDDEFNGLAYFMSERGEIFFGGVAGLNAFFPEHVLPDTTPPAVVLTELDVANRAVGFEHEEGRRILDAPIEAARRVLLDYTQSSFELHFAALHFVEPTSNRFAYQLQGFDPDWIDAGTRSFAAYTKVPPGHYTFRVRAANPDRVWNEAGLAVELSITPPFWQLPLFRAALVVLILSASWGAVTLRVRSERVRSAALETAVRRRTEELESEISVHERTQAALEEAKGAAEVANRAKSEFLARMSHEIRTPMNGVIGMTQLLLATPLDDQQSTYAETIRASGEQLMAVLGDILDLSKIEAGRLELEDEPFDLEQCVESVMDMIAPIAAKKQLELVSEVDRALPKLVRGDVVRLRQVLTNLTSNAVKFTDEGEVHLAVTFVGPSTSGRVRLAFHVRDTGIGIAADRLAQLFDPFAQGELSTTRRFGGTGLGLAISRRIAELMRGTVEVVSEQGKGSIFTAIVEVGAVSAVEPSRSVTPLLGGSVLVADAHATAASVLGGLVERWGGALTSVSTSEALFAAWSAGRTFDAVVVDVGLFGADLDALVKLLAGPRPAKRVVLVGRVGALPEDSPLRVRVDAVLTKPVKPRLLLPALTGALAGASRAPARLIPASTEALHVLVAEDNPVNQLVILGILRKMGHRAELVSNGLEALDTVLAKLAGDPFDAVLLDVQMPVMNGNDAASKIVAAVGAALRPRLVALTAAAVDEDRDACFAAGMDDFLTKPIDVASLARALAPSRRAGSPQRVDA